MADPDIAQALGRDVTGTVDLTYLEDQPLDLSDLSLNGATWSLTGDAVVDALSNAFETTFVTNLAAQDLTAFAPLIGQPVAGAATVRVEGSAALGGFFDINVTGQGDELQVGIPQADTVLRGETQLDLAAKRDADGLTLRRLTVENPQLGVTASGTLATNRADITFDTRLSNANLFVPSVNGPVTVAGTAQQTNGRWAFNTKATGPYNTTAAVLGNASDAEIHVAGKRVGRAGDLLTLAPFATAAALKLSLS